MRMLHVCAGWSDANGAAVIARLIAGEQKARGHEVSYGIWTGPRALRDADVVWTHCGWLPVLWWAGLFARRLVRMPEACYDPVRLAYHGWKKRLVKPIERFFLRRAEKVVATCEAEAAWIRAYEPRAAVEVVDIKKHFDLGTASKASGARGALHLLYLGRRHPLKGVEHLEDAMRSLARDDIELRQVSNAFGAEKERVWDWCDCLVLPTLSENFGLVIAEALERGKRVITTDGAPVWGEGVRFEELDALDGARLKLGYGGRLVYIEGYREGTPAVRVASLRRAIERLDDIRKRP